MSICKLLLVAVVYVTALSAIAAQSVSLPELQKQLDDGVPKILQRTGTPSASIAIIRDGQIAFLKAYGNSRLKPVIPATVKLRYGVGSISKQFTAAAVLLLVEDGRLSLDDKVAKFLPDLSGAGEVTIRELLSHTAGYRDDLPDNFVPIWMTKPTTPMNVLSYWAHLPLDFDPGAKFEYSNTDYIIAGVIIEKVSGMSLGAFYANRIFRPLNMGSAGMLSRSLPSNVDLTGYFHYALGPPRPAIPQSAGWLFGGGELLMNAEDLAKWDLSLLNESLLKPASYRELETESRLKNGFGTGYALGLRLSLVQGHRKFEHAGEIAGFYAENVQLPDDKAAVVVLTNAEEPTAATEIASAVVDPLVHGDENFHADNDRIRKTLLELQQGRVNRGDFTADANAYFNQEALHDYAVSLRYLGKIVGITVGQPSRRAGQWFVNYTVRFASGAVVVKTAETSDRKFAQFLVESVE